MPYIQQANIPAPEKFNFTINNFGGGLNNKESEVNIALNQSPDLLNMSFGEDVSMSKRNGLTNRLENPLNKPIFKMDIFHQTNAINEILLFSDDKPRKIDVRSEELFIGEEELDSGTFEGPIEYNQFSIGYIPSEWVNEGDIFDFADWQPIYVAGVLHGYSLEKEFVLDNPTNKFDLTIFEGDSKFVSDNPTKVHNVWKSIELINEVGKRIGFYENSMTWNVNSVPMPASFNRYVRIFRNPETTSSGVNVLQQSHSHPDWLGGGNWNTEGDKGKLRFTSDGEGEIFVYCGGEIPMGEPYPACSNYNCPYTEEMEDIVASVKPTKLAKIRVAMSISWLGTHQSWDTFPTKSPYDLKCINKAIQHGKWTTDVIEAPVYGYVTNLKWHSIVVEDDTLFVRARGSNDGETWSGWQNVPYSGSKIMSTRFIQIEFNFYISTSLSETRLQDFTFVCYGEENIMTISYINNTTNYDIGGYVSGTNYIGRYYFLDGINYYMYDGKDTYKVVEPPEDYIPDSSPATVGKWCLGTVKENVDFYNTYSDEEIAMYSSFRFEQEENKVWYEPCEQEINDNFKGANIFPTRARYIISHKDRIFIVGDEENPHAIYVSDLNNPFYFPTFMGMQLTPNGDEINGIISAFDSVVVSRHNDLHVIYGNTNRLDTDSYYLIKKINVHTGFANNNVAKVVHNHLFYLGNDGIVYQMHTTQTDVHLLATKVLSQTVDLFLPPLNFTFPDFVNANSIFYKDEYYLNIGNKTLVYNYRYFAWTVYDNINATCMMINNDQLYIGTLTGKISTFVNNYNDDGEPINAYWKSKTFNMDKPNNYKRFREFFIVAKAFDDLLSEIQIDFEVDYYKKSQVTEIIKAQIAQWDISEFGDQWIDGNIFASFPFIIDLRGRVIKFKFSNNKLDQPMLIYELNCEYEMKGRR